MNCSIKITLLLSAIALIACTGKQQADTRTLLDRYVDSMMVAYPNYSDNISVAQLICVDFEKRIVTLPGILEGAPFRVVGMSEIGGKVHLMMSAKAGTEANTGSEAERKGKFASLTLWCDDFDKDKASQIFEDRLYKVTSGKIDSYQAAHGIADPWLDLGRLYVTDLQVEPVETTK